MRLTAALFLGNSSYRLPNLLCIHHFIWIQTSLSLTEILPIAALLVTLTNQQTFWTEVISLNLTNKSLICIGGKKHRSASHVNKAQEIQSDILWNFPAGFKVSVSLRSQSVKTILSPTRSKQSILMNPWLPRADEEMQSEGLPSCEGQRLGLKSDFSSQQTRNRLAEVQ